MKRFGLVLVVVMLGGCGGPMDHPVGPTPKRVLIVTVDGLRPDVALRAEMPNMRALMKSGCFTFYGLTIDPSLTLPAHVSMLTGQKPDKHGVWTDLDRADEQVVYPSVPTLFEAAKKAGYTTAIATGKAKFEALNKPNSLDWSYIPKIYAQDGQVAQQMTEMIKQHRPQVMLVHLAGVDAAGHGSGWGSDDQVQAASDADAALGVVLAALREQNLMQETVIVLSSDHGGSGWSHWYSDDRHSRIPWIISGPQVKKNLDLTRYRELTVNIYDTFPTVCYLLKIPLESGLDGKAVLQIIDREEVRDAGAR